LTQQNSQESKQNTCLNSRPLTPSEKELLRKEAREALAGLQKIDRREAELEANHQQPADLD
jgi:hypothetical protein